MSITNFEAQAQAVESAPEVRTIEGRSQWTLTWRRLRHDKMAVASMIVIAVIALLAILAPVFAAITGHGQAQVFPNTGVSPQGLPEPPGTHGFWLGTDELGRDLLVRILYGARISPLISRGKASRPSVLYSGIA